MNTILNVIWLLFIGWELAVILAVIGLVLCCTIIGIPFGLKCFGAIPAVAWPFGRSAATSEYGG